MKVLIVSQMFYPESFQVNELATTLVEQGHEVLVVTGKPNYPKGDFFSGYGFLFPIFENYKGVSIFRVPLIPRKKGKFYQLAINYLSFVFFGILMGIPYLIFKRYDVVFSWGTSPITMAIPGVIAAKLKNKRHFVWVQDLWPETLLSVGAVKSSKILLAVGLVVRWIYRNSNLVFIQSKQFEESVKRWGGVDTEIQYLPNWAPQLFETHLKSKNANSESKIKLLFAGNLGRAQGVSYLLDAMNILKNENVVLDIYGDGSEKPLLMDKIKKLDLFDKVKLKEVLPLEQMPGLYEKYDALVVSLIDDKNLERVLPSKVQGYLASGKPILAMGSGELKRVIVESESGYVCDPEDAKSFSEIVLKFLKMSRGDRSILGSHGKNYYFNNFSRNNQINQIIQQFKKAG